MYDHCPTYGFGRHYVSSYHITLFRYEIGDHSRIHSSTHPLIHPYSSYLTLSQICPDFYVSAVYRSFENTVGKREIARNEQFLLFPQCFQPTWRTLKLSSAYFEKFGRVQTVSFGKELREEN